jgi:hypothetical protein
MSNVSDINRERAKRAAATDAAELQARIDLAHWVETYADLGAPFLLSALRNAIGAVEAFHDMIKE